MTQLIGFSTRRMPARLSAFALFPLLAIASAGAVAASEPQPTSDEASSIAHVPAEERAGAIGSTRIEPPEPLEPLSPHPQTTRTIVDHLDDHHFVRQVLNDRLSSEVFDNYLDVLDPARLYFTQTDIAQFEQWRYLLDDSLKSGDLKPAFEMFNAFQERRIARLDDLLSQIENGVDQFDFTLKESLEIDREGHPWALTTRELDHLWRQRLKATVLDMRLDGEDDEEIQSLLTKRYRTRLRRASQTESEDAFQVYANALTRAYDPHTQYFSPRSSENFNINMSLSLQGIGAVLRSEDDYTSIVRLVTGGPAERSGQLKPGDRIVGVGVGESGPVVDVVGWRLDDVVDLIRGPKDSTVRLQVKRKTQDGDQLVRIIRDTVKLEEQAARSQVIEVGEPGRTHRIGVISIPTFYADFRALRRGDADARSTTRDVRNLVEELKSEQVDGLVIDLRNNGGGSLAEANSLTGLFIKSGPTVQVKSANERVHVYSDSDGEIAWTGPMAVLVNRLSASASEIFAGAIQDYGRGIVMGSQTYGKGTVQTLIPLNRGQLKMTQAKFYRISGKSTQHQGVLPDIHFPEPLDSDEIGESALDDALAWDVIYPVRYSHSEDISQSLNQLTSRHRVRVSEDPEFEYLEALVAWNEERRNRTAISLNEQDRRAQQDSDDTTRLEIENRLRIAQGEPLLSSLDELDAGDDAEAESEVPADTQVADASIPGGSAPNLEDTDLTESPHEDEDEEEAGPLLRETAAILVDYISLQFPPVAEAG